MCPNRLGLLLALLLAGNVAATPVQRDAIADHFQSTEVRVDADAQAMQSEPILPAVSADATTTARQLSSDIVRPAAASATPPADDVAAARAALGQRSAGTKAASAAGSSGEPDPLKNLLRSLVNVTPRQAAAEHAADPLSPFEPQAGLELGEEGRAAVLAAKESLAGVVRTALDPRANDDGRISFTLAGIEGFSVTADGSSVAVGLGNATLVSLPATAAVGEAALRGATGEAGVGTPRPADHGDLNVVREIIEFSHEVVSHPLIWLVIVLAVVGRIVVSIVSARARRPRSGRSRARRASRAAKRHSRLAEDPPPPVGLRKLRRRSAA